MCSYCNNGLLPFGVAFVVVAAVCARLGDAARPPHAAITDDSQPDSDNPKIALEINREGDILLPKRTSLPGRQDVPVLGIVHLYFRRPLLEWIRAPRVFNTITSQSEVERLVGTMEFVYPGNRADLICRALPAPPGAPNATLRFRSKQFVKAKYASWVPVKTLSPENSRIQLRKGEPQIVALESSADRRLSVTKVEIETNFSEYIRFEADRASSRKYDKSRRLHFVPSILEVQLINGYSYDVAHLSSRCVPGGYPRNVSMARSSHGANSPKHCMVLSEISECLEAERAFVTSAGLPSPTTKVKEKDFTAFHLHEHSVPPLISGTQLFLFRCSTDNASEIINVRRYGYDHEFPNRICNPVKLKLTRRPFFSGALIVLSISAPCLIYGVVIAITTYCESFPIDSSRRTSDMQRSRTSVAGFAKFKLGDVQGESLRQYASLTGLCLGYMAPIVFQYALLTFRAMQQTATLGECRYNENCYLPGPNLQMPLNNLWSNAAYVVVGLLFGLKVFHVDYSTGDSKQIRQEGEKPWELLYAISITFVAEGLMSSMYHACPNRLMFQFDSYFLLLIPTLGICALAISVPKLAACEKNVSHAVPSGFKYFWMFALPVAFFNFVGSYIDAGVRMNLHVTDRHISRMGLLVSFLPWLWFVLAAHGQFYSDHPDDHTPAWIPGLLGGPRMSILELLWSWSGRLIACLISCYFIIAGKDFSQLLICLCTVAMLSFCCRVIIRAWANKSFSAARARLTAMYLVLMGVVGILALRCFAVRVADKALRPEESRSLSRKNGACVLFDAFDAHDLWHMLGALGLGFWALFVLQFAGVPNRSRHDYVRVPPTWGVTPFPCNVEMARASKGMNLSHGLCH